MSISLDIQLLYFILFLSLCKGKGKNMAKEAKLIVHVAALT
jgi:hypothetical protein